jgi:hypothetical protein
MRHVYFRYNEVAGQTDEVGEAHGQVAKPSREVADARGQLTKSPKKFWSFDSP